MPRSSSLERLNLNRGDGGDPCPAVASGPRVPFPVHSCLVLVHGRALCRVRVRSRYAVRGAASAPCASALLGNPSG